jgi:hypothetical protein
MVKNTGIPENQLSDLDYPQVLQDSHNKVLHALDVNVINSLVPSSFTKIVPSYNSDGFLTNVKYYGLGLNEIIDLQIRDTAQGTSQITSFSFSAQSPSILAGKYIELYDLVGKVVVWFCVDGISVQPVVAGATRYIKVDFITGDSVNSMASKMAATLQLDSKFSGMSLGSFSIIQNLEVGLRTNGTIGNTALLISIQPGVDSLAGKLFYLWKYDNSEKYAFYFTIDGSGAIPSHTGVTISEIALLSTDIISIISTKVMVIISNNGYFGANSTGNIVRVTYRSSGNTSGFLDSNSGITSTIVQDGENKELVQELIISYDTLGSVISVEAVL